MNIVKTSEVFEMSTIPVQLGKVEIPGDEWNKIQRMLEERHRMLVAKSVIVENLGIGNVYYKTLSEDEHVRELAKALQKIEDVRAALEEKHRLDLREYVNDNHNLEMKLKQSELNEKSLKHTVEWYKGRGFWKRVFNRSP